MQLTTFSDYSLRILIHASLKAPDFSTVGEVSSRFGISRNHVMRIVQFLGQQGLLHNVRGKSGGFTLGRPATEISIGQVVRVTEQNLTIAPCFSEESQEGRCRIEPSCRLTGILKEALGAFLMVLDGYTLQDLLQGSRGLRQLLGMGEASTQ
ncbi:MAG: Rrf2 family transcriptional regulator [Leptospiraceae bacterium]|nr:Rrf2 family transcriptional regulator [Leptospiraceae bacterium]